ncbi:MAG: hypothetical protein JEZ12_21585 [Desulfobacterium sp.]|nr:hypothetical protein [Desulfobacterium sp.]
MSKAADILNAIKHRLPGQIPNLYPTLNNAVRAIAKRLHHNDSTLVRGELTVNVTAGASSGDLPDDFWGLMGRPYIEGQMDTLAPVPDQETELQYAQPSTPQWYRLTNLSAIKLIPGSSAAAVLKGAYFQRPTKITGPTSPIPYNELFDDAIQEALVHLHGTGNTTGNPNDVQMLENYLYPIVDAVSGTIEKAAPKRIRKSNPINGRLNR